MGIFDQAPPQHPTTNQPWGQPPQPAAAPNMPAPQYPPQAAPQQPQYPPAPQHPFPPGAFPPPNAGGYGPPPGFPPQYPGASPPQAPPAGYGPPPGGYASPFDSVQNAQAGADRVPFWTQGDDGTYAVIVGEVRRFRTRMPKNIDTYSVEVKMIFSTNPRLPVGASRCKQEQATKEGADGRIKRFLMAAGNVPESGVDDRAYHASYSETQPFRGTILLVEANSGTSGAGRPFTNVVYRQPSLEELRKLAPIAQQVDPSWRPAPLQAVALQAPGR